MYSGICFEKFLILLKLLITCFIQKKKKNSKKCHNKSADATPTVHSQGELTTEWLQLLRHLHSAVSFSRRVVL